MTYIDIAKYTQLYGLIPFEVFNRLAWDASRTLDRYTTGIDNVKKLSVAFPTECCDAESVRRCCAKLINIMHQIEQVTNAAGFVETENGLRGKVISSVSAGNESVSYSVGSSAMVTEIEKAALDPAVRERLFDNAIRSCLSGVTDANGVNLLYMGRYPRR